MEEEIHYATVVFKSGATAAPKEEKEDATISSEVKPKGAATSVPEGTEDSTISFEVKPKGAATSVPEADGGAPARSHRCVLAVCLGILCVLVVTSISVIIYISVIMNEQKGNLSDFAAENEQLMAERNVLQRQTEELSRVTKNLNWTLNVILRFTTFPVNDYCPNKKCQPCLTDWILFQEKCYLFYNEASPWKTWQESRTFCQTTAADLVVIDNLHEQEFISNHSKYYYDKFHGYWLGLYEATDKNWVWIDGRNDTLGYWIMEELGTPGSCAMMIPGRNLTASWDPGNCVMQNKFICESDVLIRSDQ